MEERESVDLPGLIRAIASIGDGTVLEAIAAFAEGRAENARLRDEREWLLSRIAEEDARLSHA